MNPDEVVELIEGTPQVSKVAVNPGESNMPEITGDNMENTIPYEGKITYDIRFRALIPERDDWIQLIIDVEAQKDYYPGYDLMSVIMICLSEKVVQAEDSTKLQRLLGTLLSSEMTKAEKKDIMESEYGIPMKQEIERRVNTMCNLSETIEERGIERGIEQGMERGEDKMARLIAVLSKEQDFTMITRVSTDVELRKKLYKQYGIE